MPFDIVAFLETQTATALSPVAAVTDQIYTTQGDDLFVHSEAPLLGGLAHFAVSTPKKARIYQPSLKPAYDFYKSVLSSTLQPLNGFSDLRGRPLPLQAGEKLNAMVQNASAEYSVVIAWLMSAPITQAMLDQVHPTHRITGYADQALTVNVWNTVTPTWENDLPQGKYAIVGLKAASYLAAGPQPLATRLILPEAPDWRPGTLTSEMSADKTNVVNELGNLGHFPRMQGIEFTNTSMPKFEMISLTADTDHVFELELIKVK